MNRVWDEGRATVRAASAVQLRVLLAAMLAGVFVALSPLPLAAALLAPFLLAIIYIEPLVGLALMLLVGPWGALEQITLGNGLLDSGQLMFLLTVAAWVARGAVSRRIELPLTTAYLPLAIFVFIALLSLLDAASLTAGFREIVKWMEIGIVALMAADLSMTLDRRPIGSWLGLESEQWAWRIILLLILLGGASQALIGLWQFGLRGSGPEHFQIAGGPFYRAYGTFEQPNPFGGFVSWIAALGIGGALGVTMSGVQTKSIGRWALFWLLTLTGAGMVAFLALVFSWSRGAWLGFAVGTLSLLFFLPRKRLAGGFMLGVGLVLAILAWQLNWLPAAVAQRLASFTEDLRLGDVRGVDINDANYAVLERLAHWQAALDMAEYNPVNGVGFGNYEAAYPDFALINWPDALGHAHNYYLNILAETGILGLVAYLLFWLMIFWQTLRVITYSPWPQRGVALGLLGTWVALSTHHLLDKLYVNNLYLYLGAMWGLLHILERSARRKV